MVQAGPHWRWRRSRGELMDDRKSRRWDLGFGGLSPLQSPFWRVPWAPPAFFSMVLGIAGLSNTWRVAHRVWGLPATIGETIAICAVAVWLGLLCFYGLTWLLARSRALLDLKDPVSGN